jgi:hypothetical protein
MAQQHYYIATGKLAEDLRALSNKRLAVQKKLHKLAKSWLFKGAAVYSGYGSTTATMIPVKDQFRDPKQWKHYAKTEYLVPKVSTKAGKALAAQLAELEKQFPTGSELNKLIGLQSLAACNGGMQMRTAGLTFHEEPDGSLTPIVTVPSDYRVPAKLKNQLARLSDVNFEALTQTKTRKRVRRPK